MMKFQSTLVPLAWLHVLVACSFCQSCQHHNGENSLRTNHFCKDCLCAMCQYCAYQHKSSEGSHGVLQIRRYWYNDVISVTHIETHANVMDIQTYNSNNETVIHIKAKGSPSSHLGEKKPLPDGCIPCAVCSQAIKTPYRFCSIQCKLKQWHHDKQEKLQSNLVSWHYPSVPVLPSRSLKIVIKNSYQKKPGDPFSSAASLLSRLTDQKMASSQSTSSSDPSIPVRIINPRHGTGCRSKRRGVSVWPSSF